MELLFEDSKYSFLVDSGASMSVLKYETVKRWNVPMHHECIHIKGIGGKVQSIGYVYLTLNINGQVFEHKFHVIDYLPCIQEGIIGRDFLHRYKAILDFENNTLSLNCNNDNRILIPMVSGSLGQNEFLSIPPRCEKFFAVDSTINDECVVLPKELC